MDLKKKRINYQRKLFLPIVGLLWIIIIAVEIAQYRSDKNYRAGMIRARIEFMNSHILNLMEEDKDPTSFLQFISEYYKTSVLNNLSLTLYNAHTNEIIAQVGFPSPPPDQLPTRGKLEGSDIVANINDDSIDIQPDKAFYYNVNTSSDGRYKVQTFLPLDANVNAELQGNPWLRIIVLLVCIGITIVIYINTRHLSKNIRLLRDFASKAATDNNFDAVSEFTNDDLGEISRQVVNIYKTRKTAIDERDHEHDIALQATVERSNLKRELTNNISHELKTPAGIIKGYIDTIIDNPDMKEETRRHFLLKSQEHVERLCNILNDLSTMTRLEDGLQNIKLEKIDFKEFIDNLACEIFDCGLNGDMKLTIDIPYSCPIQGNNTLLSASIINLVRNSVAYSKGTEMSLRLLTENQRFYTFEFSDNGQGVPEDAIPQLFERFFRVDKGRSRRAGGTGLGLPIVQSSINTIGGSISVNNGENGGLTFVFTLQKWRDDANPQPQNEETNS